MRASTLTALASVLFLSHRAFAFDIYLNEESGCPDEDIDIVCEEQEVGDCCNGMVNTLYSSAQASDGQGGVVLYALNQGQAADSPNRCGLQIAQDDTCATTDVPAGSAAGARGGGGADGGDEDPSSDGDSTNGDEDGEDDGGGDHDDGIFRRERDHARSLSPQKESFIEKNKKVKRSADGWRHQQHTAYAFRNKDTVYKLSRDSVHAAEYETLTDRQAKVDFLKKHGVAKAR